MNSKLRLRNTYFYQEIQLTEAFQLLISKFVWILLSALAGFALVFLCTKFLVAPKYASTFTMYVYNNSELAAAGAINNNDLLAAESLADTYQVILKSNKMLDSVIERVGLESEISRESLSDMVNIRTVEGTQVLEITVTTKDAALSYRIADAFAAAAPEQIVNVTKAGGAEVVDRPEQMDKPVSPNIVLNSICGFLAGMIFSIAFFLFGMISDTRIYSSEDIKKVAELSVLGAIPKIGNDENGSWEVVFGGTLNYGNLGKTK